MNNEIPLVFTLEQVADYLQLSHEEMRTELESGRIPGFFVAGKWRIKRQAIEQLLEPQPFTDYATGNKDNHRDQQRNKAIMDDEAGPSARALTASPMAVPEVAMPEVAVPEVAMPEVAMPEVAMPVAFTPTSPSSTISIQINSNATSDGTDRNNAGGRAENDDALYLPTTADRHRAQIFYYSPSRGVANARQPDGQTVYINEKDFVSPIPDSLLDKIIEYIPEKSLGKLYARSIQIVSKKQSDSSPINPSTSTRDSTTRPKSTPPKPYTVEPSRQVRSPSNPSNKALRLYQDAILAAAEGRNEDARRLFKASIEQGASWQIYSAYFSFERERNRSPDVARKVAADAMKAFPDIANFYDMYGQLERRARDYDSAVEIFREGLKRFPKNNSLLWGLGQTLVQIGNKESFEEAGQIFAQLERNHKLHTDDRVYQRFKALQDSEPANLAFDFFNSAGLRVYIPTSRKHPTKFTDIVVDLHKQRVDEIFGLSGSVIVRCFKETPTKNELDEFGLYLRNLGLKEMVSLQEGRDALVNTSVGFVVVPSVDEINDGIMTKLNENKEAIIPLDNGILGRKNVDLLDALSKKLSHYLGSRNLYSETSAVSGSNFFGRDKLLLELTANVNEGRFIGIYGLRKMGKTSLILQLKEERLRNEAVVYVDLLGSSVTEDDCIPLYYELERKLYERFSTTSLSVANLFRLGKSPFLAGVSFDRKDFRTVFAEDFRLFLDQLSQGAIKNTRHVIIILDEIEKLLPVGARSGAAGYIELFGLLRSFGQAPEYRGLLSSIVIAANAAISERSYWAGRDNPVFALYESFFLAPLEHSECAQMICALGRGMSVDWEDDAVQAVVAETDGHPFLTKRLCYRITKKDKQRPLMVSAAMVSCEATDFINDPEESLGQIVDLLERNFPGEYHLLEAIAVGNRLDVSTSEVLRHLTSYSLVGEKLGDGERSYYVKSNLLRRWLRHRAGVED